MKRLVALLIAAGSLAAVCVGLNRSVCDQRQPAETAPIDLATECRQTRDWLARQLGTGCEVIVRAPLVIGGDLSREELVRWYGDMIGPYARAMTRQYDLSRPHEPIIVLLFSSEAAYLDRVERLLGERPVSTKGFYRPQLRMVVVNLDSDRHSLPHELTHALTAFDQGDLPDWFAEGLAALHEQCRVENDRLLGLSGRRLATLRSALADGRVRSLERLVRGNDFLGVDQSLGYAQARYFCLYLQEHGLLAECYGRLRVRGRDGPSGSRAIKSLFPDRSWAELDMDFRRWVEDLGAGNFRK